MRLLSILLLIPLVVAASDVPNIVPVPTERPEPPAEEAAPPDEADATSEQEDAEEAESDGESEEDAEEPAPPVDPPPPPPDEAALAECELELEALGVDFERTEPIDGPGQCGLSATYHVDEIVRGVSIAPDTELRCQTVLATARWVRRVVIPSTKVLGDDVRLTGIRHASTYVCRNRNNQSDTKISEHSKGNAVDVRSFEFEGHPDIAVEPRQRTGAVEESFQKAVRAGACLHFTTVLGPGSDAYHDDHLHLDIASRTRGFRLCQ